MVNKAKRYSKEEIESWGQGNKKCNMCFEVLPISNFKKDKKLLFGKSSNCRNCLIPNPKLQQYSSYTQEEVSSWEDGNKGCKMCNQILPFSEFHKHKKCLFGINNVCKSCRIPLSKKNYWDKPLERVMYDRAKSRAKKYNIQFNIYPEDIIIPEFCPVLGIPIFRGDGIISDNTPSLDKIIPSKGYVKGNVIVISFKANRIKSDANYEDIQKVANWLKEIIDAVVD